MTSIAKTTGVVNAFFDCVGIFFPKIGKLIIKTEKFLKKEAKNKENNVDIVKSV